MHRQFLVATFVDERGVREAVARLRAQGFRIYDVYAPYPIEGLDAVMGIPRSRLPMISLAAGLLGLIAALTLQFYTSVFDWPLNVGGKPTASTLAFVPIAFELTVLSAGLATAAALLVRCGLMPGAEAALCAPGLTDDAFAVVLRRRDATFDAGEARRTLTECGAREITIVERPS